jgi:hypothetical protein
MAANGWTNAAATFNSPTDKQQTAEPLSCAVDLT